ncbi:LIC10729 family protein [Leptospira fluminis]|uniref:LIC10729 family protein n=1 Tax=Leptospira fluminis TaxID=2484979 RepID=UPI001FE5CC2B|nr:hypothetical protein [Leptospira fluminis]
MVRFRFGCFLFLFLAIASQSPAKVENRKTKNFENFSKPMGGEAYVSENYRTFPELSVWAMHNGLKLAPDRKDPAPGAGTGVLSDNQCRMIPQEGLDILLTADPDRKDTIYVYFDLTLFDPAENSASFPTRELRIFVNGTEKRTVKFPDHALYLKALYAPAPPVRISVDPSELMEGRLLLRLESVGVDEGRFWGIWDVFLSYSAL